MPILDLSAMASRVLGGLRRPELVRDVPRLQRVATRPYRFTTEALIEFPASNLFTDVYRLSNPPRAIRYGRCREARLCYRRPVDLLRFPDPPTLAFLLDLGMELKRITVTASVPLRS